ncbi:hypothetical protein AB0F85_09515 [Nocardia fluminea]|uniref:hypothetical protein n=1 Tax=Nocardia fluminea TaxID=134984 RepID=UPI0033E187F8
MSDIDPLSDNVNNLQNSLGTPSANRPESDLVRLEVEQDGTIRQVQLSDAARSLTPDALVTEIVRVHTAAIEEAQQAIAAAIAALEADPRLAALTERRADALNQPLPEARSAPQHTPPSNAPATLPPQHTAATPRPRPTMLPAPSPYDRPIARSHQGNPHQVPNSTTLLWPIHLRPNSLGPGAASRLQKRKRTWTGTTTGRAGWSIELGSVASTVVLYSTTAG